MGTNEKFSPLYVKREEAEEIKNIERKEDVLARKRVLEKKEMMLL